MVEDKKNKGNVEKVSSEEEEKMKKARIKKLEKQIIVMFVVLGLVLLSFLAVYQIFKPKPYFKYEGFNIYRAKVPGSSQEFFLIPISGGGEKGRVVIRNDPRKLNVSIEIGDLLGGISKVWITVPPELSSDAVIAGNDLGMFTSRISLDTEFALTNSSTGFPEITCENATKETRVFLTDIGNETKVYAEGECIIVQGKNYDELLKAADALVMHWLLKLK